MLRGEDDADKPPRQAGHGLDRFPGPVAAHAGEFPDGYVVSPHSHDRAQLLYALKGIVTVSTSHGRWMVPPDHAIWIPADLEHWVRATGHISTRSIYIRTGAVAGLPTESRVTGLTDLMRSLVLEAVSLPPVYEPSSRADLIMSLILKEIPNLPERPLGLPLPADQRMGDLCRAFVTDPASGAAIDTWASELGMSRRSFTRAFRQETGLSLSAWRQQACIFASLPRLAAGEPVTGIALDLGYESAAAFATMFRRMTGVVPSRYLMKSQPE